MTTRLINIILVLFGLTSNIYSQTLKEKTEKLFGSNEKLIGKTQEFYNMNGQIIKSINSDYRNIKSITITDYTYNEKGQLTKEIFSGLQFYQDGSTIKPYTDTLIISVTLFIYNLSGQIKFKKEYSSQCNLDTCDITEFFYEGKLLIKKFCTNDCSMKRLHYNYPIYYKYDKRDSLILEQALEPTDTAKIWYARSYNYSCMPEKFIYESFYRRNDSLQLDDRTVTKTEYLSDGRESRVTFLEKTLSYEDFKYYRNRLLKSQVSFYKGKPIGKLVYKYDKRNNIVRLETFDKNKKKANKLKLYYYQTYKYKYY